ncbi:hypothetical protein [Pseudobacteriovorax antillogorgiicola]|uniref:Uncharacterized protein n=1 Tax=Pseudobacteriovorax antillogorgiicola TaxID=1513793 RepID=A0A1Y6BS27_9BACT|nr:hypothetical protein [Pseudobacteriovorax antillogorgiicola]TCS54577.1 hypothetical protein EDD56_10690 [Pseudobacteriovorax antillogorgiicola]SMF17974.1 hypothetical protein SAMN06296036_106153 [Pseudobacteriovorax antillogorgiicola]
MHKLPVSLILLGAVTSCGDKSSSNTPDPVPQKPKAPVSAMKNLVGEWQLPCSELEATDGPFEGYEVYSTYDILVTNENAIELKETLFEDEACEIKFASSVKSGTIAATDSENKFQISFTQEDKVVFDADVSAESLALLEQNLSISCNGDEIDDWDYNKPVTCQFKKAETLERTIEVNADKGTLKVVEDQDVFKKVVK